jgi:hypothetical protein
MAAVANMANAATISATTWGASPSTDGSIDWSAGNIGFSHAISFERGTPADTTYTATDGYGLTGVSAMTFYGANTGTSTGPGGTVTINAPNSHTGGNQKIGQITQEFVYGGTGGNASLVLEGLAEYTTYQMVLYQASTYTGRLIDFSFDNTGVGDATLTDVDRGNTKIVVDYTTGNNTSVTLHSDPQSNGDTMHWYAFSNAVAPDPGATTVFLTTSIPPTIPLSARISALQADRPVRWLPPATVRRGSIPSQTAGS